MPAHLMAHLYEVSMVPASIIGLSSAFILCCASNDISANFDLSCPNFKGIFQLLLAVFLSTHAHALFG